MSTREEERVGVYAQEGAPSTNPEDVTPDTPLEDLNLNWREAELPERLRTKHVHRLHPYLGKFIPQLVEIFLRKFFVCGQVVLDPFVGSGTTLVQANELGIHSIGYDVSAFNVLLCRAKTQAYNLSPMRKEILDVLEKTEVATRPSGQQFLLFETTADMPKLSAEAMDYLNQWYAPQALRELLTYLSFIHASGYEYSDLLKVILSRSARSARLTTHFDLDFPKKPQTEPYWCYKHSRYCEPTQTAMKFLRRYSIDTIRRIEAFARLRTDASVTIVHGDSRKMDIPPIDGVITSPPYVGLIDYHEQHIYAYHLLGLVDKRTLEIGAASGGSSRKAKEQYQHDIADVFRNIAKGIAPGGRMIVIAGDRQNLYGEIAQMVGVEVEAVLKRHVNRRTGRRASEFYESVFIWRKP